MPTVPLPLVAFYGQQAIKDEYLLRMETHRAANDLLRGPIGQGTSPAWKDTGGSEWRGFPADCLFHDKADPHGAAERQIGLPRQMSWLLDAIFRGLPKTRYTIWPSQFLQAIPVGADLSRVWPQLALWVLTDAEFGILHFVQTADERAVIQAVAKRYTQLVAGKKVPRNAWLTARQAADKMAATLLAAIQEAEAQHQVASDAHYVAVTDAYKYRTVGAADAVDKAHAAAIAANLAAATEAAKADADATQAVLQAARNRAAPAYDVLPAAAQAADAAHQTTTPGPKQAADVADAASAAYYAPATACTRNAAEAFVVAAFAAKGLNDTCYSNERAYISAYTDYYDALADQLLKLLAAATIPAAS